MGLTSVRPGELAAVVTYLEMTRRPAPRPMPAAPLRLARWRAPSCDAYRILFRRVGSPWLWFSRLMLDDAELTAITHNDLVHIYAILDQAGIEVGLLELDFRKAGEAELAFLGLIPELAGKGLGKWLMAQALMLAWRADITRVSVHTCTLDHPAALAFYRRSGFTPYEIAVEQFADPRLIGVLPRDVAPQIPLLDPRS